MNASATSFEGGQTVYLIDGEMAEFVSVAGDQFIVHPMIQDYEGDFYPARGIIQVPEVFDRPPVAVVEAKVSAASAELGQINAKIAEARKELFAIEQEKRSVVERLKHHTALANVELFLEGKLTHALRLDAGRIELSTLAAYFKGEDRYRTAVEIIAFTGKVDGTAGWRIYNQDRRNQADVILCQSKDEALALARAHVAKIAEAWRKAAAENRYGFYIDDLLKACRALGIEEPADIKAHVLETERQRWIKALAKSEKEAATYRQYLAAVEVRVEGEVA